MNEWKVNLQRNEFRKSRSRSHSGSRSRSSSDSRSSRKSRSVRSKKDQAKGRKTATRLRDARGRFVSMGGARKSNRKSSRKSTKSARSRRSSKGKIKKDEWMEWKKECSGSRSHARRPAELSPTDWLMNWRTALCHLHSTHLLPLHHFLNSSPLCTSPSQPLQLTQSQNYWIKKLENFNVFWWCNSKWAWRITKYIEK